jgi:hypothetical protein
MAAEHYIKAINLDPNLHFAMTGRARTYQERGCLDQALSDMRQSCSRVDDRSRRFQPASAYPVR